METLLRFQSSARPFIDGLQKNIAKHLKYDQSKPDGADEIVEIIDDSALGQLPIEIRHTICSFLAHDDLVHLSYVSCSWNLTCNEEVHWKSVFDAEKIQWDSVQCYKPNDTMWQKLAKASSNVAADLWAEENGEPQQPQAEFPKWKTTFILNHLANRPNGKKFSHEEIAANLSALNINSNLGDVAQAIKTSAPFFASKLASKLSPVMGQLKVPFKKTYRIPMLGEGLESTSKDLLYSMMWPQNSPMFKVTGLYPGIEGIGSGVGFTINDVNMNIAALHRCRLEDLRLKWRSYFQKSDGIVYVVSCKNLHNKPARKQLKIIVSGEDALVPSKVPLLVLLVCDDPQGTTIRPSEMADELKLDSLEGRPWCIQLVDMSTLKGLSEGLRWLSTKV